MNKHLKALDSYIEELEDKALQACIRDVHTHETGVLQGSLYYMIKATKDQRLIDAFNQYVAIFNMPKELERFGFDWQKRYNLGDLEKDIKVITKTWKEIEFEFKGTITEDKTIHIYPATMVALMKSLLVFFRSKKPSKIKIQLSNSFIHMTHNGSKDKESYDVMNMNLHAIHGRLSHNLFLERKVIERYFGEDSFTVWGSGTDNFKLKIKI